MNTKTRFLLILVLTLMLVALIQRDGWILRMAFPFFVYLIVGRLQAPHAAALEATRSLNKSSLTADDEIEIKISVHNKGADLAHLELEDPLFNGMKLIQGQPYLKTHLPSGAWADLLYHCKPGRGLYNWSSLKVRASDPLGLFAVNLELDAPGDLLVRPRGQAIRPITRRQQSRMYATGSIPAGQPGSGIDYWGIRAYQHGDPLRRINWRSAARYPGQLYTNQFEREDNADFAIILDTRCLTEDVTGETALFEHAISATEGLCKSYINGGNRVSLLLFGNKFQVLFPDSGKRHLHRIQVMLAGTELSEYVPFSYIGYFPGGFLTSRSMVIVFSQVDGRDLGAYASLRALGYDVVLISPNLVEFEYSRDVAKEATILAYRAARVERILRLNRLVRMGVRVIDWNVSKPLQMVVNEAIRSYHSRTAGMAAAS